VVGFGAFVVEIIIFFAIGARRDRKLADKDSRQGPQNPGV
jgi:hypothetical protein